MTAKRLVPLLLIAAVGVVAFLFLRGSGTDKLDWQLPTEPGSPPLTPQTRTFTALVSIGCNGNPAEVGPESYSVTRERWALIVTVEGEEHESGDDCFTGEEIEIRLPEPLGKRALCDGSSDPPGQRFPATPGDRPPYGPCVFRYFGEDAPVYSYGA